MSVWPIAREEWRALGRNRVALLGLSLMLLLALVAVLTAHERSRAIDTERNRFQARANADFDAQPDRHPHRMAHYGHFLFRPISPLAAFDPGIDPYTGHTVFIEAHRQNGASFGDVRQSSLLLRFGQLTPAFTLQVLAPLLLIFLGYAAMAREREGGTLRLLLAQGVRPGELLRGKALALGGIAMIAFVPALAALVWIGAGSSVAWPAALPALGLLGIGYFFWLMLWVLAVLVISTFAARRRDALLALLALWAVTVILLPRLLPGIAAMGAPLTTRFETEIAVHRDLVAMGDSHDPADPYFNAFKARTLARYGVSRIEDLPVNYKGLLGMEGERMTSDLFNAYAAKASARQERQMALVDGFGLASPVIALKRLSMTASGTDRAGYQRFVEQAEAYRYGLVQRLNRLQAEKVTLAEDGDRKRIDRATWQSHPDFVFHPSGAGETWRTAAPALAVLLLWVAGLSLLLVVAARRLGRIA
jgi:ABC-2 type transport system permease protein